MSPAHLGWDFNVEGVLFIPQPHLFRLVLVSSIKYRLALVGLSASPVVLSTMRMTRFRPPSCKETPSTLFSQSEDIFKTPLS